MTDLSTENLNGPVPAFVKNEFAEGALRVSASCLCSFVDSNDASKLMRVNKNIRELLKSVSDNCQNSSIIEGHKHTSGLHSEPSGLYQNVRLDHKWHRLSTEEKNYMLQCFMCLRTSKLIVSSSFFVNAKKGEETTEKTKSYTRDKCLEAFKIISYLRKSLTSVLLQKFQCQGITVMDADSSFQDFPTSIFTNMPMSKFEVSIGTKPAFLKLQDLSFGRTFDTRLIVPFLDGFTFPKLQKFRLGELEMAFKDKCLFGHSPIVILAPQLLLAPEDMPTEVPARMDGGESPGGPFGASETEEPTEHRTPTDSPPQRQRQVNDESSKHLPAIYNGNVDRQTRFSGYGIYSSTQFLYDGEFFHGLNHGYGAMKSANGERYNGQWRHGRRHGQGTVRHPSGRVMSGEWKADALHGRGRLVTEFSLTYDGDWDSHAWHGWGIVAVKGRLISISQFRCGAFHGYSKIRSPCGKFWDIGRFIDGKPEEMRLRVDDSGKKSVVIRAPSESAGKQSIVAFLKEVFECKVSEGNSLETAEFEKEIQSIKWPNWLEEMLSQYEFESVVDGCR
eukprot:GHVP01017812.1.p1 GENE.GHVP01017812.1~~GHVP01017812.1.p1  ORF type:complete len:560 (-),score=75.78 GHVP01017812.1:4415-6094(-)